MIFELLNQLLAGKPQVSSTIGICTSRANTGPIQI
jgi:hypothetical protein